LSYGLKHNEGPVLSDRIGRRSGSTTRALDADTGRITDANPFIQELLGYSHAEFLGKMLWEIGPFRDITAWITQYAIQNKRVD
jgi:PAS domain S-box-containing protein